MNVTKKKIIKLCSNCNRKQYVKTASCICGFVRYEDTLNDIEKRNLRLAKIDKVLLKIGKTKRIQYLKQSYQRFVQFYKEHRRFERRKNFISVHSTYQSRKVEIKMFLSDRKKDFHHHHSTYNPFPSLREKAEREGYKKELTTGLKKYHDKLVQEDLKDLKKEYLQRSTKRASTMLSPLDRKRTRAIIKQKPFACASRLNIGFSNTDSVDDILKILKMENDNLILKRTIYNRKLKKQQTREELKRERERRQLLKEKEEERFRIEMEKEQNELRKKGMSHKRASKMIVCLLQQYEIQSMHYFFQLFYRKTRIQKDHSPKALANESISTGKYNQRVGTSRRLRDVVLKNRRLQRERETTTSTDPQPHKI